MEDLDNNLKKILLDMRDSKDSALSLNYPTSYTEKYKELYGAITHVFIRNKKFMMVRISNNEYAAVVALDILNKFDKASLLANISKNGYSIVPRTFIGAEEDDQNSIQFVEED